MKALITGANGQDASYLAEFLLEKKYEVYGTIRRNSVPESQTTRIEKIHYENKIKLMYLDLTDPGSVKNVISDIKPDEIYHLGAQSHVKISYELPKYTLDVNAGGTLSVLEAVKNFCPKCKVYNASTSEMYGNCSDEDGFQRETTRMIPVSPYGCSKLFAYNLCHNYRNAYDMFICSGILFNHESPRRGVNFVTNKICFGATKIKKGLEKKLVLGNLNAKRDWGHAKDFVRAMWLMLQQEKPDDYVVATGESRSVLELVEYVFKKLNLDLKENLETNSTYHRPEELDFLKGDGSKIRNLGWKPNYGFYEMIDEMLKYWENHEIFKRMQ